MITIKDFGENDFEVMRGPQILKKIPDHVIMCLNISRQASCDWEFQRAKMMTLVYREGGGVYLYYIPELNISSCIYNGQPLFYGTFYTIDEIMVAFERSMKLYVKGFKL